MNVLTIPAVVVAIALTVGVTRWLHAKAAPLPKEEREVWLFWVGLPPTVGAVLIAVTLYFEVGQSISRIDWVPYSACAWLVLALIMCWASDRYAKRYGIPDPD